MYFQNKCSSQQVWLNQQFNCLSDANKYYAICSLKHGLLLMDSAERLWIYVPALNWTIYLRLTNLNMYY
jgi:hypothetical protein